MPTLLIHFPARRYHATPWGHHVNEGLVEWPPSPWRLLRALIATGYRTGRWNGSGPDPDARSLLLKLAGALPNYHLPQAGGAHSRHYMPTTVLNNGREKTALVFDTWVQLDTDNVLAVRWDVSLTDAEQQCLAELVKQLGYLGRSESWVEARLASPEERVSDVNCVPCAQADGLKPGHEQVALLAALDSVTFDDWRTSAINNALSDTPQVDPDKKKLTKKDQCVLADRRAKEAAYPKDLIAALQTDTAWQRQYGWNQPPGSQRVFYWRRSDALEVAISTLGRKPREPQPVEAMLLSLTSASGNRGLLPHITRTLAQADLVHKRLVSQASKHSGHSATLSGCDAQRQPLKGAHDHAHVLPLDLDGDQHLDHILIWSPKGLDAHAQSAVRAIRRTWTKGGTDALRLALVGSGNLDDFRNLRGPMGERLRGVLSPPDGATCWVSLTPFVPPRHVKKRGCNAMRGQIAAELASRGIVTSVEIDILDAREHDLARQQRHFVRIRRDSPKPAQDCGWTLALHFSEAVEGPICIGYGSHFGLGLFRSI